MGLIPGRKPSKKQRATRAAGKAGKKVTKAKVVQKAPKTAATVWAGKRSGRIVKGAAVVIVGIITLRVIRSKTSGGSEEGSADATPFPTASPVPDPAQPASGSALNGSAPQPDPTAPNAPSVSATSTPPHGDEGADVVNEKKDED